MKIKTIKTHRITLKDSDLFLILDKYLLSMKEGSILAITSKIIAICQGMVADPAEHTKDKLAMQEAEYYLPRSLSVYNFMLTVKHGTFIASAGIDESNADGLFVLWPYNPQGVANKVRAYLQKRFRLWHVGVIITDSKLTPLRSGVTGVAIVHSGFEALNDYRGKNDLFRRKLKVTQANVMDGLAGATVLAMGEGSEATPLAVVEDIPFVKFQQRDPSKKELFDLRISLWKDVYSPILKKVRWRKGDGGRPRKVLVFGIFDGLHEGHRFLLEQASQYGSHLIVVVGRDAVCKLLKHKTPRHIESQRLAMLKKNPLVSKALLGDIAQSSWNIIKRLKPDVICLGYDQGALERSLRSWISKEGKEIILRRIAKLEK
ncbi:MAG: coenzyme F420-0:L-glutamate ligase [bacterium]|nr:coenzyme F420-0:L-glutamate ligase [bacterium]